MTALKERIGICINVKGVATIVLEVVIKEDYRGIIARAHEGFRESNSSKAMVEFGTTEQ